MGDTHHNDKQATNPGFWAAFCYCILIYFTVLVLPFTILRYTVKLIGFIIDIPLAFFSKKAKESTLTRSHSAQWNVPGLEHDTPGTATPRNSYDWDSESLDGVEGQLSTSPKVLSRMSTKVSSKLLRSTSSGHRLEVRHETKHNMGFLVGRKSRENSFITEYDPCRLWDDDDGYHRCMPITRNTRLYERIIEIE